MDRIEQAIKDFKEWWAFRLGSISEEEEKVETKLSKAPGFRRGANNCFTCVLNQFEGGSSDLKCKRYGVKFESSVEAAEYVCDYWREKIDDENARTTARSAAFDKMRDEVDACNANTAARSAECRASIEALCKGDGWRANEPGPWLNPCEESKDRAKARADAIYRQVMEEREQFAKGETTKKPFLEDGHEAAVAYANALARSYDEDPCDKYGMLLEQMEANRRVGIFRTKMAEDKLSKRWEKKQKEGPWHDEWVLCEDGTRVKWSAITSYKEGVGDYTHTWVGDRCDIIPMKIEDVDRLMGKWGEKEDG